MHHGSEPNRPVVMALPSAGFDPTEAAVTWKMLEQAGEPVLFATPDGRPASADPIMVTGEGLDLWGFIPGLARVKALGLVLRANRVARDAHAAMVASPHYQAPMTYGDIHPEAIAGLVLPGGHAKSMKPFLEDGLLQSKARQCFETTRPGGHVPVAAICHGVLVLARSKRADGESIVHGRRLTALTWALEKKAWMLNRIFRFWDPHYYRTYLEGPGDASGYWSVEAEVTRALRSPDDFCVPLKGAEHYGAKTGGVVRDSPTDMRASFVVRDGNLVTARWPGDVHAFSEAFVGVLQASRQSRSKLPAGEHGS